MSTKEIPFRISLNTSTISGYNLSVEQQIEYCAKAGFGGIELWTRDICAFLKKGGSYQLIKRISGGNLSSYLDKKAQKGVSYYYAVKAYVKEPYGNTYSKYKSSSAVKRK
jgi:hypothetical protein